MKCHCVRVLKQMQSVDNVMLVLFNQKHLLHRLFKIWLAWISLTTFLLLTDSKETHVGNIFIF